MRFFKVTKSAVEKWLTKQDTYTLHRQQRHKFPRRKTLSRGIDYQWQADLAILDKLHRYNSGYKNLLVVIDIFSRYAFVVPLKTKRPSEVIDAFREIFKEQKPTLIQTDHGGEFSPKFTQFMQSVGVKHFITSSDTKASLAECLIKTLKTKLFRYFTANDTLKYIDILPSLVDAYNSSKHRSIGMAPKDVNKKNEKRLWDKQYKGYVRSRNIRGKFNIGDIVRISKFKKTFRKGYLPLWSKEYFKVADKIPTVPIVYKLMDMSDEILQGIFYEDELIRVLLPDDKNVYKINVLKKRRRKGHVEYFVHYKGYPKSYNEWISSDQLLANP